MHDVALIAFSLFAGAVLGLVHFLGLWATLLRLPALRWAPAWLLFSLLLRLGILLGGLYWIGAGDWRRYAAALGGIVLARLALTRRFTALQAGAQASKRGAP